MRTGSSPTPRSATSARRGTSLAWTDPLSMRGATKDRAQVTVNVFPNEMSFAFHLLSGLEFFFLVKQSQSVFLGKLKSSDYPLDLEHQFNNSRQRKKKVKTR